MLGDTVYEVIVKFLEDNSLKYHHDDLSVVERLLLGYTRGARKKGSNQPSEFAFLSQDMITHFVNSEIAVTDVQEAVAVAIKGSVMSYTRDKSTAVNVYRNFVRFIKREYQIDIPVIFPPTFSSEFDRQMYIVKELHEKGRGIAYLKEKLWISDRTIEEDLNKLRDGRTSIMGQKILINGVERDKGVVEFKSTVHPIFLALNLTQVVMVLQGLRHMAKNDAYKEYAVRVAANIWNELSDYARRRIEQVSDILSIDISWYRELEHRNREGLFSTEIECSYAIGSGNVLDYLKNGKECVIEYENNQGKNVILTGCIIKNYNSSTEEITVCAEGETYILKLDSLIKVAGSAEDIY
ncbi:MAG TPA: hypothetical protein PKI14_13010 [Fervidobacterium sp.]|jgi:hypothetical protein|nr:hypothetical protein [Bacillota bacterium]HHU98126.1 hypothetical protein [Petrimonas sp.]HUM43860.1 hypothetical protein [Fervidobacterium sp.]